MTDLSLKELRTKGKLTQTEAAQILHVSLRSYKSYENDASKRDTLKYSYLIEKLSLAIEINETKGILSLDDIRNTCNDIFKKYGLSYCYLFGSYAKGAPREDSDVDLLVSDEVTGLKFYELVENLREELKKNVDVLNMSQLINNRELLNEILQDGIKIYGQR